MYDFRKIAMDETTLSPLMNGRTKLDSKDVVGKTLTMTGFDFITIGEEEEAKTYPIVVFEEYPYKFYNGGAILNKICAAFLMETGLTTDECSLELSNAGGVKLHFTETRTRKGNNLIQVDIV